MSWIHYPFLRFVFFLALGIYAGKLLPLEHVPELFFPVAAFLFLLILLLNNYVYPGYWLLMVILGFGLYHHAMAPYALPMPEAGIIVLDEEEYSSSAWRRFQGHIIASRMEGEWRGDNRSLLIYLKDSARFKPGQRIAFKGVIQLPEPPLHEGAFNYRDYLIHSGIHGTIFLSPDDLTRVDYVPAFRHSLSDARRYMKERIYAWMEKPVHAQLLLGILLGEKREMDTQLRHTYSVTGAMHVLAVSGLHVGLLYGMISWLMSWWPGFLWARKIKVLLTLVLLISYAALAGFTPSVVRAVVFLSLLLISELLNRPNPLPHILFLTAFMMLIYHPFNLFQPSFQLSFMAVVGILTFMPMFDLVLTSRWKVLDFIARNVALSISVQLTTLFITVTYFHQLSLSFWASSVLVVPGAFVLLISGICLFLFASIPEVHHWVIKATGMVIDVLHAGLRQIEALPYSHISPFYLPPWILLMLPVMVYFAWISFHKKQVFFFRTSLFLFFIWWGGISHYHRTVSQSRTNAVFIRKDTWVLAQVRKGEGILWYPEKSAPEDVWMTFSIEPWFTMQGIGQITRNPLPAADHLGMTIKIDSSSVVFSRKTDNFQLRNNNQRPVLTILGPEVAGGDTLKIDLTQPGVHELKPNP